MHDSRLSRVVVAVLTAVVFVGIGTVMFGRPPTRALQEPTLLSKINASLNGLATALLLVGWVFIRYKRIVWHQCCMVAAFAVSCVFLVTYLLHHAQVGSVAYQGQGLSRLIYFAVLIPHIVLAAPVVPLALITLYRGYTRRVESHRAIARITLPLWLYVSASGVVVYFMLY
jgi:putative membrane protein